MSIQTYTGDLTVMSIQTYLNILGVSVRDRVTNFKGVVDSVSFDLYGCVQAVVRPPMNEKGELQDGRWFDVKRLELSPEGRAMSVPTFELPGLEKGPADKPVP